MRFRGIIVLFALLAVVPSVASAQGKKLFVNVGGGPTFNSGDLGERFGTGWGPAVGVTFEPNERVGMQFEYAYRWFALSDNAPIAGTKFSADHETHQLAFNFIGTLTSPDSPVRVYVTAGPGVYYRKVTVVEYQGSGIICDPWIYICGTYPIVDVLGARGGWDFGFNVGGGVAFSMSPNVEFFVESRYHYVDGPEIDATNLPTPYTGGSTKATGHYTPLTFGFRF